MRRKNHDLLNEYNHTVPYIYKKRHEKNQDIIAKEMGLIKQGATQKMFSLLT